MSALSDELALPAYSGMTNAQAATALNAKTIASIQPIQSFSIRRYLMLNSLWLDFKRSTSDTAEMARDALEEFEQFDINDPTVLAVLTSILDGLVADVSIAGFGATNKTAVLAMGDTFVSRAEQLGLRNVREGEVGRARS